MGYDLRINDIAGVRRLLCRCANGVLKEETDPKYIDIARARAIAYISSVIISAIKNGELEARIEELEKYIEKENVNG